MKLAARQREIRNWGCRCMAIASASVLLLTCHFLLPISALICMLTLFY